MSMKRMRLAFLVAGLAGLSPALDAQNAKIVCWTDANGHRACGDRVPPEYAKQERKVYDEAGRVVETIQRQKTPEEIAEAERRAAEQQASRKRAEEQAAYDRFLLSAFSSVADLEKMRDERIATLDARLQLAEKSLADNENAIRQLEAQIAAAEAEGQKAPARLRQQLAEFERTLADNRRAVEKLKHDRDQIVVKFAHDIARYRELTAAAAD
ncbi:protein of unknown function [Fontimonas thermophila]|uniref:DUF4124 domain-containing protein n=1 Tax=Fontimonas thermophila TaxID=1076937 RepID=A0A1I2JBW6_9GAMM|nr:hypothetical protein [Fontimonas thermophila]SFF51809.1 protein of unknown function [Fontimonas thermophila]